MCTLGFMSYILYNMCKPGMYWWLGLPTLWNKSAFWHGLSIFYEYLYHVHANPMWFLNYVLVVWGFAYIKLATPLGSPSRTILLASSVQTLVHCVVKYSRPPDLKSSSNVSLPFAWITGPATDPSNFWGCFFQLFVGKKNLYFCTVNIVNSNITL